MFKITIVAVFAGMACAQDVSELFNKPPADVDQALRARVDEFYQDHVTQQFRKAEAVVADDTKDFFYQANKPAYVKCSTFKVTYSDNFTKAKAIETCDQYIMMPGFADKPVTVPVPSTWKLEGGKWYWYVDPEQLKNTPWGKLKAADGAPARGGLPASLPTSADYVLRLVSPDKQSVTLTPGQAQQVTITNKAPGMSSVALDGALWGIDTKFDRTTMGVGEKAVLTLKASAEAKPGVLTLRVEQTGEVFPIQVNVDKTPAAALPEKTPATLPDPGARVPSLAVAGKVTLKLGRPQQITIANKASGASTVKLDGALAGVDAKFDRITMKAGEKAILTLKAGAKAKTGVLTLRVDETGETFPIQVSIAK